MRRVLGPISILLISIFVIPDAYGVVKPGFACSKKGSVQINAGKKFTCIKSGNRLVWNKGILISVTPKGTTSSGSGPAGMTTLTTVIPDKPETLSVKEGDPCKKMGEQIKIDSNAFLECRKFSENRLLFSKISKVHSPLSNAKSQDNLSICRLSDMRTVIPPNTYAIAYPPKPFVNYKPTGKNKVVVVGLDFSDAPGIGSPENLWKDDLDKTTRWLSWYTNGKVSFDFVTYSEWLRAPKTSENYDSENHSPKGPNDVQSGGLTTQRIAEDFVQTIEDKVDLSNVNTIWFYFPENIRNINGQFTQQTSRIATKKYGVITPQLIALGADTFKSKRARWAYFLHEMLHGFGLQGHSPKFLPPHGFTRIGAISTADGWTNALLPWDAITWGVEKPEDVFCIDKNHLANVELKLVPLEREQDGIRSAMIRLNDHQLLLVESHRYDTWGVGEGPGFAGAMVALIDTSVSTDWDNNETALSPNTISTGVYLKVDNANHGFHQGIGTRINGAQYQGIGVINGVGIAGDYEGWNLDYIMYTGESISHSGIRISLIKGGDNDTIRLEKID